MGGQAGAANERETASLEAVRQRHSYDDWAVPPAEGEHLFVWKLFLSGDELSGLTAERLARSETPTAGRVRSLWRGTPERDVLVGLDVLECASADESRAQLLRLLGDVESMALERHDRPPAGDVAFGIGETLLMYALGNLVVVARNAGRDVVSVVDHARELDEFISDRPADRGTPNAAPRLAYLDVPTERMRVSQPAPLAFEAEDPQGEGVWFKIFSSGGQVRLIDGRPSYDPRLPGERHIEVCAVGPGRRSSVRSLRLMVDE